MKLQTIFAETLVSIDAAIVAKQQIDFDTFINKCDRLCWIAMEEGDVVPSLYINMIDQALGELSHCHKDKYVKAYSKAVSRYQYDQNASEAIEPVCSPEFISEGEEASFMMEYEGECAYADNQCETFSLATTSSDFESCRFDSEKWLVKVVSDEQVEACHWIDTRGDLVKWKVKREDEYFQFIGSRTLTADAIMQIVYQKPY